MLTKKLYKVHILGNNKNKLQIINKLQDLGVIHISKSSLTHQELKNDKSILGTETISLLLLKLNYIIEETNIKKEFEIKKLPELPIVLEETNKIINTIYQKLYDLTKKKEDIIQHKKDIDSKLNQLNKIPFKLKNTNSKEFQTTLYQSQNPIKINTKTNTLIKIIKKNKKTYYKLTYLRKDKQKIEKELRNIPIKKINLPEFEDSEELKKELIKKQQTLETQIQQIQKEIQITIDGKQSKILFCLLSLENHYARYTITNKFQTTNNHFIIKGYTEPQKIEQLRNIQNINLYIEPADQDSPTKLEKKPILQNFQEILKIFSLPKYGAADPTFIIALFYPLFFGLMLADVGYGILLLLLISALTLKYKQKIKDITIIFGISAITSIIAGLLFGSFFGELILLEPIIANNFDISYQLLITSLIIGIIHINIGLILKIIQNINMNQPIQSYLQVIPYILIQIILISLALKINTLAIILTPILIILLIKNKGFFGIMDITNFFGTWFSYARILALGLATSGVALAVNIIAQKALTLGILGIFIWLTIILIGHTFNFIISIIGITINSARLHYVEFFSQFFETGGKEFDTFEIKYKIKEQ